MAILTPSFLAYLVIVGVGIALCTAVAITIAYYERHEDDR